MVNVITISGEVASGKSSISRALLALLPGWEGVNTGQKFRDFCAKQGMTIQQVSNVSDDVHKAFDDTQRDLMHKGERLIIEGRLSGWLGRELSNLYRVFCYASLDIRIERYMSRHQVSHTQAQDDIEYRDSGDIKKFKDIYGIKDYRSPLHYDLMLDTSVLEPIELARIIASETRLEFPTD